MKNVLLASLMMFSVNALALDANSSWEEINASYQTRVAAPEVALASGQATTFFSIFDLCINGDKIQTLVPRDIYKQVPVGGGHGGAQLVVIGQEILSGPMTYTVTIPAGNKGSKEISFEYTIPTVNDVDVYDNMSIGKSGRGNLLFTKSFTIPSCNN